MIEAQLVTGATQDMRILTGSALCAALAAKSAATMLANINLDKRMRSSWWRVWRRLADFDATLQSGSALGKGRNWRMLGEGTATDFVARRYGEGSSSTPPLVSTPVRPVIAAATAATVANVAKTEGRPPASIIPTTVGPMIEANRSQAVATPTASARTRVG